MSQWKLEKKINFNETIQKLKPQIENHSYFESNGQHFSPTTILRSYFDLVANIGRSMPFLVEPTVHSAPGMPLMLNNLDACNFDETRQLHLFATCMLQDDSLLQQIADAFTNEIQDSLQNPSNETKWTDLDHFTVQIGFLFQDHLLYVPEGPCRTECCGNATMTHLQIILGSRKPSS